MSAHAGDAPCRPAVTPGPSEPACSTPRPARDRADSLVRTRRTGARPRRRRARRRPAARALGAPGAVGSREQPDHGRARAAHERRVGARLAAPGSGRARSPGTARSRRACRSLCSSSRRRHGRAQLERGLAARRASLAARACVRGRPAGPPARTPPRWRARPRTAARARRTGRLGVGKRAAAARPRRVASQRPGRELRGHVGAERARPALEQQLVGPEPRRAARPAAARPPRRPSRRPGRRRPGCA